MLHNSAPPLAPFGATFKCGTVFIAVLAEKVGIFIFSKTASPLKVVPK